MSPGETGNVPGVDPGVWATLNDGCVRPHGFNLAHVGSCVHSMRGVNRGISFTRTFRYLYMMTCILGLQGFFGGQAVLEAQMYDPVARQNPALQTGVPATSGFFDLKLLCLLQTTSISFISAIICVLVFIKGV